MATARLANVNVRPSSHRPRSFERHRLTRCVRTFSFFQNATQRRETRERERRFLRRGRQVPQPPPNPIFQQSFYSGNRKTEWQNGCRQRDSFFKGVGVRPLVKIKKLSRQIGIRVARQLFFKGEGVRPLMRTLHNGERCF